MNRMRIPFNKAGLVGNELSYLLDAVKRGQISGDGFYTGECNSRIRALTGSVAAFLTHSCTAALEMAAMLCDLGPGDEVIMPSFTFVSTANAVALRGATPIFVDIDPATLNIDPVQAAAAVTQNTKAIFAVHYAGFPADMDALMGIAQQNQLVVVEDAAQAFGSTYKGRPAGSLGDIAAFSFHETKNITSGEGGAITLNRSDLIERAEIIREKGTNRSQFYRGSIDKYTWMDLGSSYLPGELISAFLYAQLENIDAITKNRQALFDRYQEAFQSLASAGRVRLPVIPPHCVGNGHMFYLLLNTLEERTQFIAHMVKCGVITPFHYVPLHSAPAGRKFGHTPMPMPHTNHISETLVRMPLFNALGNEVETVIESALAFFAPTSGRPQ